MASPRDTLFGQTQGLKVSHSRPHPARAHDTRPASGGAAPAGWTCPASSLGVGWGPELSTDLDKVQLGCWVPGPHAQHKGSPGPVDVVHTQHGGPQEAGAPGPLVVQHAEQCLHLRGEMLDLESRPGTGAASSEDAHQTGAWARPPHPTHWAPRNSSLPPRLPCPPASPRLQKGQMADPPHTLGPGVSQRICYGTLETLYRDCS